jgi:hypothetical protein
MNLPEEPLQLGGLGLAQYRRVVAPQMPEHVRDLGISDEGAANDEGSASRAV